MKLIQRWLVLLISRNAPDMGDDVQPITMVEVLDESWLYAARQAKGQGEAPWCRLVVLGPIPNVDDIDKVCNWWLDTLTGRRTLEECGFKVDPRVSFAASSKP